MKDDIGSSLDKNSFEQWKQDNQLNRLVPNGGGHGTCPTCGRCRCCSGGIRQPWITW